MRLCFDDVSVGYEKGSWLTNGFAGWNWITWTIAINFAFSGLFVSWCVVAALSSYYVGHRNEPYSRHETHTRGASHQRRITPRPRLCSPSCVVDRFGASACEGHLSLIGFVVFLRTGVLSITGS
jgi:hypothetical protein